MTPVYMAACTLLAGAWWRTWRPSTATPGPASPAASAGRTAGTPPSRSSSSCSRSTPHDVLFITFFCSLHFLHRQQRTMHYGYMIIRGWVNEHFISSKAIVINNVNILGILSFMSSLLNCQKRTPIRCHKSSICYLVSSLPTQTEKIM